MKRSNKDELVTRGMLGEAVDAILVGMDNLAKNMATKDDLKEFATKDDLKEFATKDDLKREISFVRDDIKGLEGELSNTVSKSEFNRLKSKVDKYIHD